MLRKFLWLAAVIAAGVVLDAVILYITKMSGPLNFRIKLMPEMDFLN